MLEVPLVWPHYMLLHPDPVITTGKLELPSTLSQVLGVEFSRTHLSNIVNVCAFSVTLTGSYCLFGAVNGVKMSLLLDTGAAVTLL